MASQEGIMITHQTEEDHMPQHSWVNLWVLYIINNKGQRVLNATNAAFDPTAAKSWLSAQV